MGVSMRAATSDSAVLSVDAPAQHGPVLERVQQVSGGQSLAQDVFYPAARLVGGLGGVPAQPQLLHVLVQRRDGRHGGGGVVGCAGEQQRGVGGSRCGRVCRGKEKGTSSCEGEGGRGRNQRMPGRRRCPCTHASAGGGMPVAARQPPPSHRTTASLVADACTVTLASRHCKASTTCTRIIQHGEATRRREALVVELEDAAAALAPSHAGR